MLAALPPELAALVAQWLPRQAARDFVALNVLALQRSGRLPAAAGVDFAPIATLLELAARPEHIGELRARLECGDTERDFSLTKFIRAAAGANNVPALQCAAERFELDPEVLLCAAGAPGAGYGVLDWCLAQPHTSAWQCAMVKITAGAEVPIVVHLWAKLQHAIDYTARDIISAFIDADNTAALEWLCKRHRRIPEVVLKAAHTPEMVDWARARGATGTANALFIRGVLLDAPYLLALAWSREDAQYPLITINIRHIRVGTLEWIAAQNFPAEEVQAYFENYMALPALRDGSDSAALAALWRQTQQDYSKILRALVNPVEYLPAEEAVRRLEWCVANTAATWAEVAAVYATRPNRCRLAARLLAQAFPAQQRA